MPSSRAKRKPAPRRAIRKTLLPSDPGFFGLFRTRVVPWLKTFPSTRLWYSECKSPEELLNLMIILEEERLNRYRVYVTDAAETTLRQNKQWILPATSLKRLESAYHDAGGARSLRDYVSVKKDKLIVDDLLKRNLAYFQSSPLTDESFNEFQVVFYRHGLDELQDPIKERLLGVLHKSLCRFGFLGICKKDSLKGTMFEHKFTRLEDGFSLFKRTE